MLDRPGQRDGGATYQTAAAIEPVANAFNAVVGPTADALDPAIDAQLFIAAIAVHDQGALSADRPVQSVA